MIGWLLIACIAVIISIGINNSKLRTKLYVDKRTGKISVYEFEQRSENILKYAKPNEYLLVSLDVDNFKYINEIYGYETGNKVLKMISDYIEKILPDQLLLNVRVAADNFIFIAKTSNKEKIVEALSNNKELEYDIRTNIGAAYDLAFSVGLYVISDPSDRMSNMMDYANIARKSLKGHFGNTIAEYTDAMNRSVIMKRNITVNMEASLKKKEFEVWLQPKYSLDAGTLIGAEVLVRWKHPELGLIPPSDFIPLFEENGFIEKLDLYMFENTCRLISEWKEHNVLKIPMVSVNMSRITLNKPNLVSTLKNMADSYEVEHHYLEIEITEGALEKTTANILNIINDLKREGFAVSIDDFGSGYSSLSILKDVPADILKIDREFLSNTFETDKGKTIIDNVIKMSKELNLQTVAEGIETAEQAKELRSMGCDVAQGYFFAKPMDSQAFQAMLLFE